MQKQPQGALEMEGKDEKRGSLEGEGHWDKCGFLRSVVWDPPGMTFAVAKSAFSFDIFLVEPNLISTGRV